MNRIIADFVNGITTEQGYISFIQQDTNTCTLSIKLTHNDIDVNLTDKKVIIAIETPSGAVIERDVVIVDALTGEITYTLPYNAIVEEGKHLAQIQLYNLEPFSRVSTIAFSYMTSKSIVTDQKLIASSEFGTLQELILTVSSLEGEVSSNVETIEEAQIKAEQAKNDAIMSASYAIQSSNSAKEALVAANETLSVLDSVIEQAQASATASKESSEASKASADAAERANNTALIAANKADIAATTANTALTNVNNAIIDIQTAKDKADEAQTTANNAMSGINGAIANVNQAVDKANQSISTANTALTTANNTLSLVNQANNTAQSTANQLEGAITTANNTISKANQVNATTTQLISEANTLTLAANKAVADATIQANTAKTEATKATTQATIAKTEADRVAGAVARLDAKDLEQDNRLTTLENEPSSNVTLNDAEQTKFNFIADKIVSDGLEKEILNSLPVKKGVIFDTFTNNEQTDFSIILDFTYKEMNYTQGLCGSHSSGSIGGFYFAVASNLPKAIRLSCHDGEGYKSYNFNATPMQDGKRYLIGIVKDNKTFTMFFDGNIYNVETTGVKENVRELVFGGINNTVTYEGISEYKKVLFYNRALSPSEIAHNFQVLNNSPSISQLSTTDSEGKESIHTFATDSEHVTMRNGFNLEESYTGLAKTMARDFSSTGEDIVINNGVDKTKILSATIEGQTVKNYCIPYTRSVNYNSFKHIITVDGIDAPPDIPFNIRNDNIGDMVEPNKEYDLWVFIEKNYGDATKKLYIDSGSNRITAGYIQFNGDLTGWQKQTITTISDTKGKGFSTYSANGSPNGLKFSNVVILPKDTPFNNKYIPFGLNSAQAIISNGANKHTFYEPTIQGETVVQKRAKGSSNEWVTIPQDETRDTVASEYRLYSPSGLGSVPSVSDKVDLASGVKTDNTKEVVLNGSENWKWTANYAYLESFNDCIGGSNGVGSNIPFQSAFWSDTNSKGFIISSSKTMNVRVNGINDLTSFKAWLTQNPTTIRYQLATPTTIQLTPQQLQAYEAHKKPISLGGVGGVTDSVRILSDNSLSVINNTKDIVLNGNEVWTEYSNQNNDTTMFFVSDLSLGVLSTSDNSAIRVTSDKFTGLSRVGCYTQTILIEGICDVYKSSSNLSLNSLGIRILKSKLTSQDVNGLKAWLAQNPVTVRYQLATPTTTHIPKQLCPTIAVNKSNILSTGDAVKASKLDVSVPVDKISELENSMIQLTNILNSPSNLSLTANYVEDEYQRELDNINQI